MIKGELIRYKKKLSLSLSILISIFLVYVVLRNFDFVDFKRRLSDVEYKYILYYIVIYLATLIIRGVRLTTISGESKTIKNLKEFSVITLISGLYNSVLPFGAGELYKIGQLTHRRKGISSLGNVTSCVFVERIMDVLFACISMLILPFFLPISLNYVLVSAIVLSVVLVLVLAVIFVSRKAMQNKKINIILCRINNRYLKTIINFVFNFLKEIKELIYNGKIMEVILSTLVYWFISGVLVYVKGKMFNLDFDTSVIITNMVFIFIVIVIPASPGMFGTYHAAVIASLSIFSFSFDTAKAYSVFSHGINFISMVGFGAIPYSIIFFRRLRNYK